MAGEGAEALCVARLLYEVHPLSLSLLDLRKCACFSSSSSEHLRMAEGVPAAYIRNLYLEFLAKCSLPTHPETTSWLEGRQDSVNAWTLVHVWLLCSRELCLNNLARRTFQGWGFVPESWDDSFMPYMFWGRRWWQTGTFFFLLQEGSVSECPPPLFFPTHTAGSSLLTAVCFKVTW